jgi:DNA-binding NarL/FixJ family response regulator
VPIAVGGRAIGMLHADRPTAQSCVTTEHLEELEAFAECLSAAFESAVLEDKCTRQLIEVGNFGTQVKAFGDQLPSAATGAPHHTNGGFAARQAQPSAKALAALTRRECEVLSHMATGATNAQIARTMDISDAGVKSHLRRISKKLGTSHRAAAVAIYLGTDSPSAPESRSTSSTSRPTASPIRMPVTAINPPSV